MHVGSMARMILMQRLKVIMSITQLQVLLSTGLINLCDFIYGAIRLAAIIDSKYLDCGFLNLGTWLLRLASTTLPWFYHSFIGFLSEFPSSLKALGAGGGVLISFATLAPVHLVWQFVRRYGDNLGLCSFCTCKGLSQEEFQNKHIFRTWCHSFQSPGLLLVLSVEQLLHESSL